MERYVGVFRELRWCPTLIVSRFKLAFKGILMKWGIYYEMQLSTQNVITGIQMVYSLVY